MAKTRRARWLVWIPVSALAGLLLYYFHGSRPQVDASPAAAAGSDAKSADPSLSSRRSPIEAAPQRAASEFKLVVNGVMITAGSRTALISVDDRPAAPFLEGQQIADGVVLHSVRPDRVMVKRGDDLLRLPLRGVQSSGSAGSEQSAGGLESIPTDLPPAGSEQGPRPRDSD
ncbi:MAG: hypothetical protein E6H49_16620 [Betaproteobacteria bacterium]|jgi:hypothetical protein|nr:MAG: hypothetical protein E6H56_06675 [Betaproteobacteria bacterium]TMH77573.1 MAG: hypothetical protein E6H49_16620 [Betaproteobacteria bacterium]